MSDETTRSAKSRVRELSGAPNERDRMSHGSALRRRVPHTCEDCRAETAFQLWATQDLTPSFNSEIDFSAYGIPPTGKRAVIELVTAQIVVPQGEWVRLRMYTSLVGSGTGNFDLFLTFQGSYGGQAIYVASHNIRAYTDGLLAFDVNRDNAQTTGSALIAVSGYLADT